MRVIRRIDRGGFGFVEEVETVSGDRVARKCFDPPSRDSAELANLRRRFEREVRIQSALKHPNIMPIFEVRLTEAPPWFTMPLATMSLDMKLSEDHRTNGFDTTPWPDILARATGTAANNTPCTLSVDLIRVINSADAYDLYFGSIVTANDVRRNPIPTDDM